MTRERSYFLKYILIIILFVLSILSSIWIYKTFTKEYKTVSNILNHYDYVIVGGGTAGCVLASRLSENKSKSVLLVEAGDYFDTLSSVPLLAVLLQRTKYDWSFKTESQKFSSFGLYEQKQVLPRGKGLGGSNQLNYMIHGENILNDIADWRKFGITIWNYNELNAYLHGILKNNSNLLKSKSCINDFGTSNTCELDALFNLTETESELSDLLKLAATESTEINVSYSPVKNTIVRGQRWTSYHSHLKPAFDRNNLHLLLNSQVTKVLFNNTHAIGVETINNYRKKIIYSRNEIILSSGTFMNPKILILSGIGPSHILKKYGIKTVLELPGVGRNLHDHLGMPLYVSIKKPISITMDKILRVKEFWNYIFHQKGILSTTPILGYAKKSNSGLILFGMGSTDEKYLREIANLKSETFGSLFPLYKNTSQEGFVFLSTCLKPKSRGYVTIKNCDVNNDPIINPQYLSRYQDIGCMIEAIKLAKNIIQTKTFKNIGAKLHWPILKNCNHLPVDSSNDDYLECVLRTGALTMHHPGGTCRIGNYNDRLTVVDELLRVKGVTGLRIVDASILPEPLSTFPNSLLIVMAEYANNLIINNIKI